MKLLAKGHGFFTLTMSFFYYILFLSFFLPAQASAIELYTQELLSKATEKSLHTDRYWEVLLHYKKNISFHESLIDDPKFFLSPQGKINPKAELEATIRSFFQEDKNNGTHSRCRFPARYSWLQETLSIDEEKLPSVTCNELDDTLSKVDPQKAVMVFPASFMNSPASMFGHTLLRIDSSYESKLLSYAVNYAAQTNETNGLTFAFKGIFGYYNGYYSILPYYEKVKEYNNLDKRDIWEYSLDLSPHEVKRMFLHIWELKDIYSHYYFFDENCSYNLLFLLEAANPSLHLTDNSFFWVIPVDTIKILKKQGLITDVSYRPSIATKIKNLSSSLSKSSLNLSIDTANGEKNSQEILQLNVSKEEKIKSLDLITEIIQYKYSKRTIDKETYTNHFHENLMVRSTLGKASAEPPEPDSNDPVSGHDSGKFSFGLGSRGNEIFSEFDFRPAYQTLFDPQKGYIEGGQIVFFDVSIRHYEKSGLKIEKIDILDLVSLSPRNSVFKPLSWGISLGMEMKEFQSGMHHIYYIHPAVGVTYENKLFGLCYILVGTDLDINKEFEHGYSMGLGATIGISTNINDYWKMNLYFKAASFGLGEKHDSYKTVFVNNFQLTPNSSISFSYTDEKYVSITSDEVMLSLNYYF